MNKKIIIQFLLIPLLFIFEMLLHELGHAMIWRLNGVTQMSLSFNFNITLNYIVRTPILDLSQIMASMMGPIFGGIFCISGLIISNKCDLNVLKIWFQITLLSEMFQLVIPFEGTDLSKIQSKDQGVGSFIQIICLIISGFLIVFLMRTIYKTIDIYYKSRIIKQYNDTI